MEKAAQSHHLSEEQVDLMLGPEVEPEEFFEEEGAPEPEAATGRTDEAVARREDQANFDLRGYWAIHREMAHIEARVRRQKDALALWAQKKLEPLTRQLLRREASLRAIGEAHIASGAKAKYIDLPSGRVSWRLPSARIVVKDVEAAIAELKGTGIEGVIDTEEIPATTKQAINKTVLRKAAAVPTRAQPRLAESDNIAMRVEATGEVLEHIEFAMDQALTLDVKPPKIEVRDEGPAANSAADTS